MISRIIGGVSRVVRRRVAQQRRWMKTRHLHGPEFVELSDTQAMVTLLARNSSWFIRKFIEHHFSLGAAHILVIDNGSTDATVDICRNYDRLTVLQNDLPAKLYESALRSELSQRVAKGGWILFADSDELIEIPTGGLTRLLGYCNDRGYTSVLGQMLDHFSTLPYRELRYMDYAESIKAHNLYSLRQIEVIPYFDQHATSFNWFLRNNICDHPQISFRRGGVRAELFGENPFLSKHSLVRNLPGITPMPHPHCATNVTLADTMLLVRHYKLAGDWVARDRLAIREGRWDHGEDSRRISAIGDENAMRLDPQEPRPWRGIDTLRDEGFLFSSAEFLAAMQDDPETSGQVACAQIRAGGAGL
ncbi:glycosyltransferase [Paracoccus denitrificans]|uniref:Glycosyltransferase family 2 protein n=2 Tax=Paracoccus denitrificans TaxID=266 RepID=A1B9N2_PARDP|nr:hypothetical protein Pden_4162 [Paracoccus denitrificans PD1222]QAR28799.1 glycosyltransferase [Paracoccus denitrificans]SDI81821.1 Glycosyl transferase family 2 [Paracoccus denitrificans]SFR10044.1 Glycosyl transferase family 2 [Paracoccus denitrificans]